MKTAEEIIQKHIYRNVESFGDAVTVDGAISAMEEYANQFKDKAVNELKSNVSPSSEVEKSWYCWNANSGFGRCEFQCGKCKKEQQEK